MKRKILVVVLIASFSLMFVLVVKPDVAQARESARVSSVSCDNVLVRGFTDKPFVEVEVDSVLNGPWVIAVGSAQVVGGRFTVNAPFFHPPFPDQTPVLVKVSVHNGDSQQATQIAEIHAVVSCKIRPKVQIVAATTEGVIVRGTTDKRFVDVEIDNLSTNGWVVGWLNTQVSSSHYQVTVPYFHPPFPIGTLLLVKVSLIGDDGIKVKVGEFRVKINSQGNGTIPTATPVPIDPGYTPTPLPTETPQMPPNFTPTPTPTLPPTLPPTFQPPTIVPNS